MLILCKLFSRFRLNAHRGQSVDTKSTILQKSLAAKGIQVLKRSLREPGFGGVRKAGRITDPLPNLRGDASDGVHGSVSGDDVARATP